MKKFIVIIVVLLIAGGGLWWFLSHRQAATADEPATKTAKVTRGDIEMTLEATGSVESNLDVDIKCKASGEIQLLPYDVSDSVPKYAKGQNEEKSLLVALDPVDENHRVQQAQAAVNADKARVQQAASNVEVAKANALTGKLEAQAAVTSAKAKNEMAQLTLKRTKELFDKSVGTQDELDNASTIARVAAADLQTALSKQEAVKGLELTIQLREAELNLAEANASNSQIALADAMQRLTDTKIYSPIDGVVTGRPVQVGQIVASGISTVGGGTSLMTVSDLSRVFVVASVDESDIGHLVETGQLSQEVLITADAYPGKKFRGKVVQITPRGASESNVVTYPVKIEVLDEGKKLLLPKMTANVKIQANRKADVLLVPNSAIRYEKERPYVELVGGDDMLQRRWVKIGLSDGVQAEVLEGLAAGDEVVGGGAATKWSNDGKSTTTQPSIRIRRDGTPRIR